MTTYTSTLPDDLLKRLTEIAKELKLPKNKLIEKALTRYLDDIKKAQYAKSFQKVAQSKEMMELAEEGLPEYFKTLKELEKQ